MSPLAPVSPLYCGIHTINLQSFHPADGRLVCWGWRDNSVQHSAVISSAAAGLRLRLLFSFDPLVAAAGKETPGGGGPPQQLYGGKESAYRYFKFR